MKKEEGNNEHSDLLDIWLGSRLVLLNELHNPKKLIEKMTRRYLPKIKVDNSQNETYAIRTLHTHIWKHFSKKIFFQFLNVLDTNLNENKTVLDYFRNELHKLNGFMLKSDQIVELKYNLYKMTNDVFNSSNDNIRSKLTIDECQCEFITSSRIVRNSSYVSSTFNQNIQSPTVNKSINQMENENNVGYYSMYNEPHGNVLIINNVFYKNTTFSNRIGSDIDRNRLIHLWQELNFNVFVLQNGTLDFAEECLKDFAKRSNANEFDALIVCILSHGDVDKIYFCDGYPMGLKEIFDNFNQILLNKPKLFFIQSCRGAESEETRLNEQEMYAKLKSDLAVALNTPTKNTHITRDITLELPKRLDFFVFYSTIPGHVSYRMEDTGSRFIESLYTIFFQYAHANTLDSLTKLIQKDMVCRSQSPLHDVQYSQITEAHGYLQKHTLLDIWLTSVRQCQLIVRSFHGTMVSSSNVHPNRGLFGYNRYNINQQYGMENKKN
ncbi:hypothetical protein SNEBB_001764 [Seison nebaliae]|nr:hypothetical protein SNEBB_001764 [Seison nebaliae]